MSGSRTGKPRRQPLMILMALVTLTIIVACSGDEKTSRDTASAGGTISQADAPRTSVVDDAKQDIETYRLTMDKVNRFYEAHREGTIAAGNRAQSDTLEDLESIDQLVKEIEREPKVAGAIRQAGLSPREFVVMSLALMSAMMAHEVLKTVPNADVDSLAREMEIPAANIHFVREHRAEIDAKAKTAELAIRAAGVRIDE